MTGRGVMAVAAAAATLVLLSGCGSYAAAHDFNAPTPARTWQPQGGWIRIETPGNFPSAVFACRGRDGLYASMDSSSTVIAVPDDPECKARG